MRSFVKLWDYAKAGWAYTLGLYWMWLSSVMPRFYDGRDARNSAFDRMSLWRQNVSDGYACAVCYGGSLAAYMDNRDIYHRYGLFFEWTILYRRSLLRRRFRGKNLLKERRSPEFCTLGKLG